MVQFEGNAARQKTKAGHYPTGKVEGMPGEYTKGQLYTLLWRMYHYVHAQTDNMRRVFSEMNKTLKKIENRFEVFDTDNARDAIAELFPVEAQSELFSVEWNLDDFKHRLRRLRSVDWDQASRADLAETLLEMSDDIGDNLTEYIYVAEQVTQARKLIDWSEDRSDTNKKIGEYFPIEGGGAVGTVTLNVSDFGRFLEPEDL